jgi:eukaryotic-like serine/threonine-protein kinase
VSSPSSKNDKKPPLLYRALQGPQYDLRPFPDVFCNFSLTADTPALPREERACRRRTREPVESTTQTLSNGPRQRQTILGRYELLGKLGSGGFGVVWRAHDELLGREVAVKRIWLGEDGDADRARREARATARLAHPAIVALYEAHIEGEAFYLISELVHGHTLGRLIASDQLEDEEIFEIGVDLCAALDHAHERGVIHRDIKPQNVLIPDDPTARTAAGRLVTAKLTDFGGASIAGQDALTRTGDVLGTLAYMAPEQSEGHEVTEQADLYSLALVLYEALTGENPVRGATPAATARRIGARQPSLGRVRRDLPVEVTATIDAALDPSPDRRGSIEELGYALRAAIEDLDEDVPRPRRILPKRPSRPVPTAIQRPREAVDQEPSPPAAWPAEEVVAPSRLPKPDHGGLPRSLWIGLALAGCAWLSATGRPGAALLLAVALLPLAAMPVEPYSRRVSPMWLAGLSAPLLGLAGLAGAYPAIAGQASRWRQRLVLGAIGYWWLLLAEPLLSRRLWLGTPPPHSAWEGSLTNTANHVLGPLLSVGSLLGASLWGVAALLLAWVVRGRRVALDAVAVVVWSALLCAAAPALDAGLGHAASHPSPRGAVLGAVLGGLIALGARALRGPV